MLVYTTLSQPIRSLESCHRLEAPASGHRRRWMAVTIPRIAPEANTIQEYPIRWQVVDPEDACTVSLDHPRIETIDAAQSSHGVHCVRLR